MAVEVRIPPVLRKYTGGVNTVQSSGTTVAEVLASLESQYGGLGSHIRDERGQLHRFVNIYRNGEDIRYLNQLETPVGDGDVVAILPAIAGGA
ncbi:MAG: MoaD/ThiS family protein [Chloroflexi bacterium]|nr:MoaD/ThiS family protein [Chloroflexota bacterium]